MCTVVARWDGSRPTQLLALRDELTSREFDDPGSWWSEFPDVVGGRDRVAGGTWCASSIGTGVTALVLNRGPKRIADVGAPSRGVLPLAGVRYGAGWPAHLALKGMASFALVLAAHDQLVSWVFEGDSLTRTDHEPGAHMFTSGGAEDGKAERYLEAFDAAHYPDGWRALVQQAIPADDPAALVVRHQRGDDVYATVFAQLIEARPGHIALEYSREPWRDEPWQTITLAA